MGNNRRPARAPICSPELTAEQFEEMLAELDAICRQARELTTRITLEMDQRKHQDLPLAGVVRFGGRK